MDSKINHLPTKKIKNQTCRHYWHIESSHGQKSLGICKYCGKEKEFTIYFEDILEEMKSNKASN